MTQPAKPTKPTEDWRPVEGKPHLYQDRISGRMKYEPPVPPDPTFQWLFNAQQAKKP